MRKPLLFGGAAAAFFASNAYAVNPTIVVPDAVLLPNRAGQTVQIMVSGGVSVSGLDFNAEVAGGGTIMSFDDILAHVDHGEHFRDQRTRFFEAASFKRFHRDNTAPGAIGTFEDDVYHGVIDVHRDRHETLLRRVDAVMKHASILPVSLIGRTVRVPVKQGNCHHLANDGRLKWAP